MLSLDDYFMGREIRYKIELTNDLLANAEITCGRVNTLLELFYADYPQEAPRSVNSGWRPAALNATTPNASKKSKHITCQAIDLEDDDGLLDEWCLSNQTLLVQHNLWLEHPASTKGWCHLQTVPPKSNNRVFYP